MNSNAYLVTYDVSSPKRWRRVFKRLKRAGERLQLSVFLVTCARSRARRLEQELRSMIDPDSDRLLFLELGAKVTLGIAGEMESATPRALIV
jgi:CRISPR-associated protein Cas2